MTMKSNNTVEVAEASLPNVFEYFVGDNGEENCSKDSALRGLVAGPGRQFT